MQLDPNDLPVALGPVTGTGTGSLTVTASRSMSLTMACIGRGQVTVTGPLSGAMLCSVSRGAGTFSGWYWAHLKVRPGERIRLRVAADAHTRWDIRVDG